MSEGTASKDPIEFVVRPIPTPAENGSVSAGLSELAQMARQAFEEKRRKQSLALANAILKIDPGFKEALVIQSWVRADLQKDLNTARAVADEANTKKSLPLLDRAEALVRATLNIDAENEDAKAMLRDVISAQNSLAKSSPPGEDEEEEEFAPSVPVQAPTTRPSWGRRFVVIAVMGVLAAGGVFGWSRFRHRDEFPASEPQPQNADTTSAEKDGTNTAAETGVLDLFVLPASGVQLVVDDSSPQPVPQKIELSAGVHRLRFIADGFTPEIRTETVQVGKHRVVPVLLKSATANVPASTPAAESSELTNKSAKTPPPGRQSTPPPSKPAPAPFGTLVLNAAVPVDVYLAGKQLGTTPLSVSLPPGLQTLEYRYQNLQKTASYVIKVDQPTTATIAFEVPLQINARPWATVLIEGGVNLGQTPLSNVNVPVGAVLVFQNSSFSEKRVRVTGKEKEIQVVMN